MSAEVDMELLISVCAGLGRWVEDKRGRSVYAKDKDCAACLKDLQRFLRRDNPETREVFMLLGRYNLVKTDLVPLLITYPNDEDLLYNTLKVVTYLTMPISPESDSQAQQADYMQQVKDAFLAKDAMSVVMGLVMGPLGHHPDMTEQDCVVVQLVLTFIRNLLSIPDSSSSNTAAGDHKSRMQVDLLERLFQDHVMELLLSMAQYVEDADDTFQPELLLEIFHQVFKGVDPAALVAAPAVEATAATGNRRAQNSAVMRELMEQEAAARRSRAPVGRAGRMGAIIASHKSMAGGKKAPISGPSLKGHRGRRGMAAPPPRALGTAMASQLRAYAEALLQQSYAILMAAMKDKLEALVGYERERSPDMQRYMRVVAFFTAFVRLRLEAAGEGAAQPLVSQSPFATISATFGHSTVNFLFKHWSTQMAESLKGPDKDWELQGAAVVCLKEQLRGLQLALRRGSAHDRTAADSIFCAVLHNDSEESGLLPAAARQIKQFNHMLQRKEVAEATVEIMHVVTEQLSELSSRNFVVARKRAKKVPKKVKGGLEEGEGGATELAEGEAAQVNGGEGERELAPMEELLGEGEEEEGEGGDEAEVSRATAVKEVELNKKELSRRLMIKLANPAVIHFYVWVLQGYATNSHTLNSAIVDMLRRVCDPDELNCEAMLYQLSVLCVFHTILSDAPLWKDKRYHCLLDFCKQVVRRMFRRMMPEPASPAEGAGVEAEGGAEDERAAWEAAWAMKSTELKGAAQQEAGAMMFVELMFWKDRGAAKEVQSCYDIDLLLAEEYRAGRAAVWNEVLPEPGQKDNGPSFSEPQMEELRTLWELHRCSRDTFQLVAEEFGGGVTRQQVARALREAGATKAEFDEEQTMKLQLAWEEYEVEGAQEALVKCTTDLALFPITKVAAKLREIGIKVQVKSKATAAAISVRLTEEELQRAAELYNEAGGGKAGEMAVRAQLPQLKSHKAVRTALKEIGDAAHGLTAAQLEAVKEAHEQLRGSMSKRPAKVTAAVIEALPEGCDAAAPAIRKALVHLGILRAAPKFSEEQVLTLQAMHETLTRASDFWNVALDEFGTEFSKARISGQLKKMGLVPPQSGGDDDSDSDDEAEGQDNDAPAGAQRLGGALHKLGSLRGTDKLALGTAWLTRLLKEVLEQWSESSYAEAHPLSPSSAEERALIEEPRFVKVLRLLRFTKDEDLGMWCFPGARGSLWVSSVQDALRNAREVAQELKAAAEEEEADEKLSEADSDGDEEEEEEEEEETDEAPKRRGGQPPRSAQQLDGAAAGRGMMDWSDEDSDAEAEVEAGRKRLRQHAATLPSDDDEQEGKRSDEREEGTQPFSVGGFDEHGADADIGGPSGPCSKQRLLKRLGRSEETEEGTPAFSVGRFGDDLGDVDVDNSPRACGKQKALKRLGRRKPAVSNDASDSDVDVDDVPKADEDSPLAGGVGRKSGRALLDDDIDSDGDGDRDAAAVSRTGMASEDFKAATQPRLPTAAPAGRRGRLSRLQAMGGAGEESESDEEQAICAGGAAMDSPVSSHEVGLGSEGASPSNSDGSRRSTKRKSPSPDLQADDASASPSAVAFGEAQAKRSRLRKRNNDAADEGLDDLQLSHIVSMGSDLDDP